MEKLDKPLEKPLISLVGALFDFCPKYFYFFEIIYLSLLGRG